MNLQQALVSLRDINGVTGSFIVSTGGQLLARDTSSLLSEELLAPVGPRLVRLWDTLREVDQSLDQAVITYESQKLYVRPVATGLLCTIVPLGTNMPALRMAVNLLLKKVNPRLLQLQSEPRQPHAAPPHPGHYETSQFDTGQSEVSRDTAPSFLPPVSLNTRPSQPPLERGSVPPDASQAGARYIVHRGRRYLA